MFISVFNTIVPVLVCALAGYLWARRGYPYETGFVTLLVTNVGFPCLIFETLTTVELNAEVLLLMGLAALATIT